MRRFLGAAAIALLLSGCLARQLRQPASELHQQAQMIRDGCERDGYPSQLCNQETLQVLTESTCLVEAIVNGDDGQGCTPAQKKRKPAE